MGNITGVRMITHGIIPQCQTSFWKITHGKITQYDYLWCYTPVSNYILKDYPGKNTKAKSLSMIIHSILAKCRTPFWKITQGQTTMGKITLYDYPYYYTPVSDYIRIDYPG